MHVVYLLSVWLHLLAAMAWVGGMIFLVAVVVPLLRKPDMRERAAELMRLSGTRFRVVGWVSLVTLVATGVFNVMHRGYPFSAFFTGELYQGQWGHTLAHKLGLVGVVLLMSVVHDFWIGPTAVSDTDAERRERFRKLASVFGRVTFALALAIVALAVTLVRG
jgi:copper resistance protein D